MKLFFLSYGLVSIFSVIVVSYWKTTQEVASFSLGALLTLANILLLSWGWNLIFRKKLIALATSVIVFKYAILGLFIYFVIQDGRVSVAWMSAGLSMLLPSILVYAFINHRVN